MKMLCKTLGHPKRSGRRLILSILAVFVLAYFIIRGRSYSERVHGGTRNTGTLREETHQTAGVRSEIYTCKRPKLQLWQTRMKTFFHRSASINCSQSQDWVYIENGTFYIHKSVREKVGEINCSYSSLDYINDETTRLGKTENPIKNGDKIPSDFFEVVCQSHGGATYNNLHSAIRRKEEVARKRNTIKCPANVECMNILMFGFDSVSRLNWIRNLPKSYEYYVSSLGGVVLEGYNVVGDGTPRALLPILTGHKEAELPEARREAKNAQRVDGHPWIWKDLSKLGYVTQWGEDGATIGTFSLRMKGFAEQPVDHYLRPFQLWAEQHHYKQNMDYCLGSKPRHINMFEWINHFFDAYPDIPKFSFLFHSELSHDHFSKLTAIDDDLLEFLRHLNSSGRLENTLLILMADHGARFGESRKSHQGKYEARLPFFSFRFPEWFSKKFPDLVDNLKRNKQALTTPFDIHATFEDILQLNDDRRESTRGRANSLLRYIPGNRTCHEADIAPHWCTCLDWMNKSLTDSHVVAAAREIVGVINNLLKNHLDSCEELKLDTIVDAVSYTPNKNVLKFEKSMGDHGQMVGLSDKMQKSTEYYQITIQTEPGGGVFEGTVTHEISEGDKLVIDKSAISRTNKYGNHPHCIVATYPNVRQYCYCKVQLES